MHFLCQSTEGKVVIGNTEAILIEIKLCDRFVLVAVQLTALVLPTNVDE